METDRPVSSQEEDRFNRWNYAEAVSKELATVHGYGVTIGVYGAWGSGKTTFLRFVETHLKTLKKSEPIWLNYWLWQGWEVSAQILFKRIFTSLGEDYAKWKNRIADKAQKLVQLMPKFTLQEPQTGIKGQIDFASTASLLGQIAQIDLVEIREKLLKKKDTIEAITVFVDDIDRLETQEIRELFRFLRFFSEIPNLNFLVAMDPDIVSPSLQLTFEGAGQEVLDKFIQLPVYLSPPNPPALVEMLSESLEMVFKKHDVSLTDSEKRLLNQGVRPLLLRVLSKPRQVRLIANTLSVSLQTLKGEVNYADLVFIKTLSITHPHFVQQLYVERNLVMGKDLDLRYHLSKEENLTKKELQDTFEQDWNQLKGADAMEILQFLFPQTKGILRLNAGATSYSHHEVGDRSQKRICHEDYFQRYFEVSLSQDIVKEKDLDRFIKTLNSESKHEKISQELEPFLKERAYQSILGLEVRIKSMTSPARRTLGLLIAKNADLLSEENEKPHIFAGFLSPWSMAADLVVKLFFPDAKITVEAITELIRASHPVSFAIEWAHAAKDKMNNDDLFWDWFSTALAKVVDEENQKSKVPVFLRYRGKNLFLLDLWLEGSGPDNATSYMEEILEKNPTLLVEFVAIYSKRSRVEVSNGMTKEASEIETSELETIYKLLTDKAIKTCLESLGKNPQQLLSFEKYKQTAFYQFSKAQLEKHSFLWSKASPRGLYHTHDCPKAKLISSNNMEKGEPPSSRRAHSCVLDYEKELRSNFQLVLETLSTVENIESQNWIPI